MAELNTGCYTLRDWMKDWMGPDGETLLPIVNMICQTNPIMDHIMWIESNMVDGNKVLIENAWPETVLRTLYEGYVASKGGMIQVTDVMGEFGNKMEVDKKLAELNGMKEQFFIRRSRPHIGSLTQEVVDFLFYGDRTTHPKGFDGLAKRYPYSDSPNVINAGGSGSDLTSLWLAVWGENVHGIFPKGTKAGLQQTDPKLVDITDEQNGGTFEGFRKYFTWNAGLTLADWRYVVRVCNIETTGTSNIYDVKKSIDAAYKIPNLLNGKAYWYCNRTVAAQLHYAAINKSNAALTLEQARDGGSVKEVNLHGIPVAVCDAILITEDELTATP